MGWAGSFLLLLGIYLVGHKTHYGWLIALAGEILWVIHAWQTKQTDLFCICLLFCFAYLRNYFKAKE